MLCPILIMLGMSLLACGFLVVALFLHWLIGKETIRSKQSRKNKPKTDMYYQRIETYDTGFAACISYTVVVALIVLIILAALIVPREVQTYKNAYEYFSTIEQTDTLDMAGAIIAKTEANKWLWISQAQKQVYGIFSPYPDSVMDLEAIK